MTKHTLGKLALWCVAGVAGLGALGFGINALTSLNEHPERTGEVYGMATASAICLFVVSYIRGVIRDREEIARNAALARAVTQPVLHGAQPDWGAVPDRSVTPADGAPVRVERDCPYCAERILAAAKLCKHCRSDVSNV